jgi:uncharacterized protein (TIGR03089 family)
VEPGDRVALLLPAHWQTAVWVAACFATGTVAAPLGDPAGADVVVSGPETLEAARACRGERVALALRPLGGRFPEPPEGFRDYAVEVPGQGDQFVPYVAVDPAGPALEPAGGQPLSGTEVAERAAGPRRRSASPPAPGCSPAARRTTGTASPPACSRPSPWAPRSCSAATSTRSPPTGWRTGCPPNASPERSPDHSHG